MKRRIDGFLYRKEKPVWERALLLPLYLVSIPYGWAARMKVSYELDLKRPRRLPFPVISVGNLTVGGTGKTPLVMALASGLAQKGIRVAILSRGYRGTCASGAVVSDGASVLLSPEEAGDEPYLMASTLPAIPVLVGKNRFESGRRALESFGIQGVLLDDGYQHLQLHRDLNLLLIDSRVGFGDGHLLPRGILREPVSQLRRADLVLFNKADPGSGATTLEEDIRRRYPSLPVYHGHYEAVGLVGPRGEREALEGLRGRKVVALSGIANPEDFSSLLKKCGMQVIKKEAFPDHYPYTQEDLQSIEHRNTEAEGIVTTEKDLVRLARLKAGRLPIRALRIEMKIREERELFEKVAGLFSTREKVT
jgi:tetraacyldisaccharide 4'-kinase